MDDLIRRQAAINEVQRFIGYLDQDMIDRLKIAIGRLPSEEQIIIHCKDCTHWTSENGWRCEMWNRYVSDEEFFCGFGERTETDE